jgi:hypothetical protein
MGNHVEFELLLLCWLKRFPYERETSVFPVCSGSNGYATHDFESSGFSTETFFSVAFRWRIFDN